VYADLLHKPPAPDPGAALEYYNRALSSARATGMLGWELRAAISLAEFLLAQDNSDQALASLRDVRGKFAPDEVSADLLEADRLLGTVRQ
jgi:hypothetical protein